MRQKYNTGGDARVEICVSGTAVATENPLEESRVKDVLVPPRAKDDNSPLVKARKLMVADRTLVLKCMRAHACMCVYVCVCVCVYVCVRV